MKKTGHKHDHAEPLPQALLQDALAIIETSDYRLTRPRRALLETILAQKEPFSAPSLEKLFARAAGKKSACDPVTIYRTLPVFEDLGIIEKCDFSDGVAHYEVRLGHADHHHHHIVCKSCRKVEPLEFCIVEGQEQILQRLGYTQLTHKLEFTGLCPKCST